MNDLTFLGQLLPDTWTIGHLVDVTSKIGSGATPRGGSAVYVDAGPAFIRSQNIYDNVFQREGLVYLTDEAADQLRGVTVAPDDVLINITGDSILRTCVVPPDVLPARVSQHVAIIRSNGRVVPGFLQKVLSLPAMKDFMLGHSAGGTRKAITKGHLLSFPLPLPPINEQRAIAATLRALDDKIESNRRAINVAEQLADQLFVINAVDLVILTDVARLTMGSSPPGDTYNEDGEGLPFYQGVRDFGRRYPGHRVWTTGAIRLAHDNDSLVSVRAPVGELNRSLETCCIGRGVAAVSSKFSSCIYYSLRASDTIWEPFQHAGTVFGAINKSDLSNARLSWPVSDALDSLENQLSIIDEKIRSLSKEIEELTVLRDTLLPELLSGRLRAGEAKEAFL